MWRLAGTGLNIYFVITYFMGQLGAGLSRSSGSSPRWTWVRVWVLIKLWHSAELSGSVLASHPYRDPSYPLTIHTPCARFNNFIIFART